MVTELMLLPVLLCLCYDLAALYANVPKVLALGVFHGTAKKRTSLCRLGDARPARQRPGPTPRPYAQGQGFHYKGGYQSAVFNENPATSPAD